MSALGGMVSGGLTLTVRNTGSAAIPRGRVVSFNGTAVPTTLGDLSQPTFVTPVTEFDGTKAAGVAITPIGVDELGTIVSQGPALMEATANTLNVNDVVEIDATASDEGKAIIFGSGDRVGVAMSDAFLEDLSGNDFSSTARNFVWVIMDVSISDFVGA